MPATSPLEITQGQRLSDDPIIQIVSGYSHSCVLHKQGKVYCWGSNTNGQLGIGEPVSIPDPTTTHEILMEAGNLQIAAAYNQTCVITSKNDVYCWGANAGGCLGFIDGNVKPVTKNQYVPLQIPGIIDVIAISIGVDHTCVIDSAQDLECWGSNKMGQLGNEGSDFQLPSKTANLIGPIQQVVAGDHQTFALHTDEKVYVTGQNQNKELGMGEEEKAYYPLFKPNNALTFIHRLESGPKHACAIHKNGKVSCWGHNLFAAVGTRKSTPFVAEPTIIDIY